MKDFYQVLGLPPFASLQDIKKAYRSSALKHHPDRGGTQEKMQEINEAHDFLMKNKETYDLKIRRAFGSLKREMKIKVNGWDYGMASNSNTTSGFTYTFTT